MMLKVLVSIAALAAGCASAQKPAAASKPVAYNTPGQPAPPGLMRCHLERDTGSNMMQKVCDYREDDATRRETQEEIQRLGTAGSANIKSLGGGN